MTNVYGSTTPPNTGSVAAPKAILTEFSVASNSTLNAVRIYSSALMDAGDFYITIYDSDGGAPLAEWNQTINTAVGWHSYTLPSPLSLAAGAHYTVNVARQTGTMDYVYNLGALPVTTNGITFHGTAVRSGTWPVPTEWQDATDLDTYYYDVEVDTPTALDVNAGADQNIFTTQTAALVGSASGGSGTKTYTWTKVSGPAGSFGSPSSASTSFTPSGGAGVYVLRLLVTDSSGTDQDDVTITVTTAPTLVSYDSLASSTGWTPTGGTALAVISDSSDSTLLTSSDNPVNVLLDGYLPAAVTAPGAGQNFVTRVRCDRPGSSSGTITGRLYEGATLRSTVVVAVPASLGDVDIVFPAADLAAIAPTSWTTVVTGTRSAMRVTLSATAAV